MRRIGCGGSRLGGVTGIEYRRVREIHAERKPDDKCFVSLYCEPVKIHDWRVRTKTGENRLWRATKHGGKWAFMSRLQRSEEGWTEHEKISLEDLQKMREVLFNKYQRRRLPWEDVVQIDAMIEDVQAAVDGEDTAGNMAQDNNRQ